MHFGQMYPVISSKAYSRRESSTHADVESRSIADWDQFVTNMSGTDGSWPPTSTNFDVI